MATDNIEIEIKIDKGIPIPTRVTRDTNRYPPLMTMDIGDSFLRPISERTLLISTVNNMRHRSTRRFATKVIPDGIRVWRIK